MTLPRTIFRSYDIRGVYPKELDETGALHIGKALGTFLVRKNTNDKKINVVVGRDSRKSSPTIKEQFVKGLTSTGCNVTDVDISLTPIIHFLTCVKDFDAGVLVTASHNPKEFNGFRLDFRNAASFHGDHITSLYDLVVSEDYEIGQGVVTQEDLYFEYLNFLKEHFSFTKDIKVVIDCGFGTTSYFAQQIFEELGCNVVAVYCTPDNTFPQGAPDPERKQFIRELEKKVLEHNADVGFAFDTDSDRLGVVDAAGKSYENDKIILLLAKFLLKNNPGGTIVYDIKCSNLLHDFIVGWKGNPIMIRTGHPYVMQEMKKGAILGGEFSGHMFLGGEFFGYDDGILAACKVIDILLSSNNSLASLMADFPSRYHTSEIKIPCPDSDKFKIVSEVTQEVLSKSSEFVAITTIDGVRVSVTSTGWFLVRASNTSPYLSIRVEGIDDEELSILKSGVKSLLSKYKTLVLDNLDDAQVIIS